MSNTLATASPTPYWLDSPRRPAPRPALSGSTRCELAIVGGGYSGLWTAILAKEADPSLNVLVVEGNRVGWAASGRNGGFCSASLTHGDANGAARFPDEQARLDELDLANLDELEESLRRYDIDCDFERPGKFEIAVAPHQVEELATVRGEFLDQTQIQAEIHSPTYLAAVLSRRTTAILDPAQLAWGLARTAEGLGVRVVENTRVHRLGPAGGHVAVETDHGTIRADRVALGTNAFRPLLRRLRQSIVPVYDYVLMTEPLTDAQLGQIGWTGRQAVGDMSNQFHYYRLTADNRILWGGYDAIYHYGRRIRAEYDQRPETFSALAANFRTTFPQLDTVRFTHRWGGVIDTCTRFCPFFGTAYDGRVAYALGFTGSGVGVTRFGAKVMLDLLSGKSTELTELELVRRRPAPFPPEPFAYLGIQATRRSLARADRNGGRRNLWLRALDRVGWGFES